MNRFVIVKRVEKVIESCNDIQQLDVAYNYIQLAMKKIQPERGNWDMSNQVALGTWCSIKNSLERRLFDKRRELR